MIYRKVLLIGLFIFICKVNCYSWVFPEHRDIANKAISLLSPNNKQKLTELWLTARTGFEQRLSQSLDDTSDLESITKIDFTSLPAIGGDHSCSPKDMINSVLYSDWILPVANITAELKREIASVDSNESYKIVNYLRNSDIQIQRVDPDYADRSRANFAHFLLAANGVNITLNDYINSCIKEGTELNIVGAYSIFHLSALVKAAKLSNSKMTDKEYPELVMAILADEAFALHLLEDSFAAGHTAGIWGDVAQRKGTHDYYNIVGIKANSWEKEIFTITGDAYIRPQDIDKAASVIKISIEQVLEMMNSGIELIDNPSVYNFKKPNDYDLCSESFMPKLNCNAHFMKLLTEVISKTPLPGLTNGIGELPRFRSEIGLFVGFTPSVNITSISNGFASNQDYPGFVAGAEVSFNIGMGFDGVLNDAGDGLAFLSAGKKLEGASSSGIVDQSVLKNYGSLLSAIPARSPYTFRIRLPFYLFPGDLLLASPFLALASEKTLENMVVVASNGGLIPWQSGISTSIGRFQFVLGREFAVSLFGFSRINDVLIYSLVKNEIGGYNTNFVSFKSTMFEFPILEYRFLKNFSNDQRSSLYIQLYAGVDIPYRVEVIEPKHIETPVFNNIWFFGFRIKFDWRQYF